MEFFELIKHTSKHRKRVYILGESLLHLYPDWTRWMLAAHDIEKYLFMPWLYKYSGGKGNRLAARKLYDRMNATGAVIRALVGLWCGAAPGSATMKILDNVEHIADVVDRHCHPNTGREMGQVVQPPMSNFLPSSLLAEAELLKTKYFQLIPADLM